MCFQRLPLAVHDLGFSISDTGSLLDLLYKYPFPLVCSLYLPLLAVVLLLQRFESLDFHHEVQLFLLLDKFLFQLLVLLDLFVTDGNDFRVETNLIHLLHIIELFVELLLGSGEEPLLPLLVL